MIIPKKELDKKSDEELLNIINTQADKHEACKNKILELNEEFEIIAKNYENALMLLKDRTSKIKDDDDLI